jgi:hypothetical protein
MLKKLKIFYLRNILSCNKLSQTVEYDGGQTKDLSYEFFCSPDNLWVYNWVKDDRKLLHVSESVQYRMCTELIKASEENNAIQCDEYEEYLNRYFPTYDGLSEKKYHMIIEILNGAKIITPCILNIRRTVRPKKLVLNDGAHRAAISLALGSSVKIGF